MNKLRQLLKNILLRIPFIDKIVLDRMMEIPHGDRGIDKVGHRIYVGGLWEKMGNLQFDFLLKQGIQPSSTFIDVACGSLRLGRIMIAYLDRGNYMGIDKEKKLIDAGKRQELNEALIVEKEPQFVISSSFDFSSFNKKADFAIAQSLFTHLPPDLIEKCFLNLYEMTNAGGFFYATFFESTEKVKNYEIPHDHARFFYTKREMLEFGESCGWESEYIGDWNHPRDQMIVKYTKPKS